MFHRYLCPVLTVAALGCSSTPAPNDATPATAEPAPTQSTVAPPASSQAPEAKRPETQQPVDPFARSLFREVAKKPGNLALSAPNLGEVLGAVTLGARGKTAEELARALGTETNAQTLVAQAKADADAWRKAAGSAELITASRLWHEKKTALLPAYAGQAKEAYGAEPEGVDFAGKPEAGRKSINDWTKAQTKGLIPELLAKGSIDASTRLVATSALYLKAAWATPFSAKSTAPQPFAIDGKTQKPVPTMFHKGSMQLARSSDFVAVDLPYAKSALAMLVVVPTGNDPSALEATYAEKGLPAFTESLERQQVALHLPKFSFATGGSLGNALKALGVTTAFGNDADFSGLFETPTGPLYLSDVVQRTFIKVDENGTEAAAASAAIVAVRSVIVQEPIEVKVDRPFLFFLHDDGGRVLFAGRVADPTAK